MQQLFANKRNHVMILSLWFVIVVGRLVGCCFFNYLELHVGRFVFFFCSTVSSFFREFLNVLFAYLSLSLITLMRIVIFFCYGHSSACRLNVLLFLGLI